MQVEQLGSDIYLLTGKTYGSNSKAFIKGDEVLLVDTMASREDAQELKRYVDTDLRKRVSFVLCTHYFSDHIAGLSLFPEAEIIAHRNYRHTFDTELFRSEEERGFFVPPTMLIGDGLTLKWGRNTLDIFYSPGHTMSTLGVDVPDADLLLVGDTLVGNIAYFLYTTPSLLVTTLENLLRRGRSRVLASHAGLTSQKALRNALFYLRRLEENVRVARSRPDANNQILAIALERCLPPEVLPSDFEKFFHQRNLQAVVDRTLFAMD